MPETRELRSVVDAAEQAAAAGDYPSAEQHLREAVRLQEAQLGPFHPELANTLNNLGVVCEIVDKPADAELCYRRACSIATAVLAPDHPFVTTSRKNLSGFCEARGKSVELPSSPPAVKARWQLPPAASVQPHRDRPSRPMSRSFAIARAGPVAIGFVFVMLMALAARSWFVSNRRAGVSPATATQSSPPSTASTPEPLAIEPKQQASSPARERSPAPKEAATGSGGLVNAREGRATRASAPAPPTVADAHLCTNLSTTGDSPGEWRCDRPSPPVDPGLLFFYTRLKSPVDTTVQHRWYRGDQLRMAVKLRIRANSTDGYRTYSRNTVDRQSGGSWRVELRTEDGILLHEERFVVSSLIAHDR